MLYLASFQSTVAKPTFGLMRKPLSSKTAEVRPTERLQEALSKAGVTVSIVLQNPEIPHSYSNPYIVRIPKNNQAQLERIIAKDRDNAWFTDNIHSQFMYHKNLFQVELT